MRNEEPIDLRNRANLLLIWRNRAIRANLGHYRASSFYRLWSAVFTCFNLVSAIAVLFFANNRIIVQYFHEAQVFPDAITAVASLFVVLTTALQYVLKLDQKAKDHKNAGNDFTSIKRSVEQFLVEGTLDEARIKEIAIMHAHTSKNYLLVPNFLWKRIEARVRNSISEDAVFVDPIREKYGLGPSQRP